MASKLAYLANRTGIDVTNTVITRVRTRRRYLSLFNVESPLKYVEIGCNARVQRARA